MVYIMLADGFEEVEALCPMDIMLRAGLQVKTVGVTGEYVTGSHGITVRADILSEDMECRFDAVMFPGGMPGALNLDSAECTDRVLSRAAECEAHIAAICAAPLVLGRRGLLIGKRATCYPGFEKELQGAICTGERVVTDGCYTTAVGMGASAELGLELVCVLCGSEKAEEIKTSAHIR